jgi:2-oxoglutarate dehydrogenase E1 component
MAGPDYSNIANAQYIDELYENYRVNPDSVTNDWRAFFQGFELGSQRSEDPVVSDDDTHHGPIPW